jgi:hypothetical protein
MLSLVSESVGQWDRGQWTVDGGRWTDDRRCRDAIYRVRIMQDSKNLKEKITNYKLQKKEEPYSQPMHPCIHASMQPCSHVPMPHHSQIPHPPNPPSPHSPISPPPHLPIIPLLLFVLLLVFPGATFTKYHPEIKWKEISNERFIVVFPMGYREEAVYTLNAAQQLYDRLIQLWGTQMKGQSKIRILLSDGYDDSNGSATFFPYNQIEVYLFTPPPDSTIGSGKDWIRLVLAHELTHIINFNAGSGFTYFMRKILGTNPLLYPVIYVPGWILEGMAVYAESQTDEGGRLNTPDYRLMLNEIARAGKMPVWGNFWGEPTSWPGGTSKYLYGAAFISFLAEKYGSYKIPELVKTFAFYSIPFTFTQGLEPRMLTIHQRFKRVFEKSSRELWGEFLQYFEARVKDNMNNPIDGENHNQAHNLKSLNSPHNKVTFLTQTGKFKKYPIFTKDEKIVYVNHNYKEYPGVYQLDIKTRKSRRLIKKSGINGLYYSSQENKIYFSAADYFKSFYQFSDIYCLDLEANRVKRLSRGARLSYPVEDPADRNKIYCVKRVNTGSYLSVFDLKTRISKIISAGFDSMAYIAVSPDNRCIAASLKRKDQQWAIALFSPDGQLKKVLTEGQGKCYYPVWKNAHLLFFICQYNNHYCLAAVDLKTDIFYIYDDPHIPAVNFFSLKAGERNHKLVASFFDSNGYNLGLMDLARLEKKTKEKAAAGVSGENKQESRDVEEKSNPAPGYKSKSYNSLRDLVPKYISGYFRYNSNELKSGIIMSGHDLSYRNSFVLETYYGFRSKTTDIDFTYTYDGWYPTLSFHYSDLSDFNHSSDYGDFIHNEKKFEIVGYYPLRINTHDRAYLYSNFHIETVGDRYLNLSGQNRLKLNGIKLGIFYNSAQRYYDSISYADGISLSLSYSREFKWLGSDYNSNSAALQYKQYVSLSRPNVLALHLGITDSWGEASRLFYMGGADSKEGFHVAGDNLFDLMRGYPSGYRVGTGGYLFNIEYRISLFKIEKAFWISRSVERLYLSLFADIGHVWMEKWALDPSYSLGMELNLVAFLGGIKLNISGGMAVGYRPYHSPLLYLRIGNSF